MVQLIPVITLPSLPPSWADAATNLNHIAASFDQEAAAVVMARMAVARYAVLVFLHLLDRQLFSRTQDIVDTVVCFSQIRE